MGGREECAGGTDDGHEKGHTKKGGNEGWILNSFLRTEGSEK